MNDGNLAYDRYRWKFQRPSQTSLDPPIWMAFEYSILPILQVPLHLVIPAQRKSLPIFIWECKCRRNTHFADRVAHLLYSLPTLLFALQPYKLVPLCTLLCDSIFRETQYYKSRCLLSYKFIGTKMKRGSEREKKFVAGITRRVFERSVV